MNKLLPFLSFVIILGFLAFLFLASREKAEAPAPAVPELSQALNESPEVIKEDSPVSLAALARQEYDGRELKLERVLESNSAYTRHYITYKSGELTISGIMNIPKGEAPVKGWPLLILNHGHIDTEIYTNGRGLKREQDYFARNGFAVLHPDYRDHAESSKGNEDRLKTRVGYAEDVINAVYAVRAADLPVNKEVIGMLGHSMGGGIAQTAAIVKPDLVRAVVLYAPVSLDYRDSYERWMSREQESVRDIAERYGTPESSPEFWDGLNGKKKISQIQIPLAYYHGTADADVPIAWTEETVRLLKEAGKPVELTVYQGEGHEFGPKWNDFMRSSAAFFREHGVK